MRADPYTSKKRLKRSLLLLAVPLLSVLFLSTGNGSTVGKFVRSWAPLPITISHGHFSDRRWLIRRVAGVFEVENKSPNDSDYVPDRRGVSMSVKQVKGRPRSGFWAPTRVHHIEWWLQADFARLASDEAEYWEAMGPTIDDYPQHLQQMLDELISRVPNRVEGLVETTRGRGRRDYEAHSILLSGYIHNTIVLLCAGAGFFEFGRAIRQRRRERSAGVQEE